MNKEDKIKKEKITRCTDHYCKDCKKKLYPQSGWVAGILILLLMMWATILTAIEFAPYE